MRPEGPCAARDRPFDGLDADLAEGMRLVYGRRPTAVRRAYTKGNQR